MGDDGAAGPSVANSKEIGERRVLITALSSDVDRQLDSAEGRARDIQTRASILIAASSILVGLSSRADLHPTWFAAAAVLSGCAAVLGVAVLLPRWSTELRVRDEERRLWNDGDTVALRELMYAKVAVLSDVEHGLIWRAWVISAGFAALAASVAASVFAVLM